MNAMGCGLVNGKVGESESRESEGWRVESQRVGESETMNQQ